MIATEQLQALLALQPTEPRGWFRWLHSHYFVFHGVFFGGANYKEHEKKLWDLLSDKPTSLLEQVADDQLLLAVLNRHAWLAGNNSLDATVRACWQKLEPKARGAFLAGASENDPDDNFWGVVLYSLPAVAFSPDCLCQLACNAIKHQRFDVLAALLDSVGNLEATIRRYDPMENPFDSQASIDVLSHRVIDMILEAALIWYRHDAAKLALQHGADPNIPIWELQRSYNQKYSPLGFAIEERTRELAELLLEYGASPSGIPYAGYTHEISLAVKKGWDDFAERLISMAGKSGPSAGTGKFVGRWPNSFGHTKDELDWAHTVIGGIIPFVAITEKQFFYQADAQGGQYSTMLDKVVGKLERLKHYEALGLDTRLTAEEFCTAVDRNAYEGLGYLLSKFGNDVRERVFAAIREQKPEFGGGYS